MSNGGKIPPAVSQQTIKRLPHYLKYLRNLPTGGRERISASTIAADLSFYEVLVRKDLAIVSNVSGKPGVGFVVSELIADIEYFLGYDMPSRAVLAGAGRLGAALLYYGGFAECGLEIVAAFDVDEKIVGGEICGKRIFHVEKAVDLCPRLNARIGIVTAPAGAAQGICDIFAQSGVLAIWNFAPVQIKAPGHILVQNENMAESLAILSNHITEKRRSP
jgi:redox-sensing transcriptional repressor